MTEAPKIVLELTYRADASMFRATVFDSNSKVIDMWEATAHRTLRSLVVAAHASYTHTRGAGGNGPIDSIVWSHSTGWEDAVLNLKNSMMNWAKAEGVDVSRNANPLKVVELVIAERIAIAERAAAKVTKDAEELAYKTARDTRSADRADFDVWEAATRAANEYSTPERRLAQAVSMARSTVNGWDEILEKHVRDVSAHPCHALEWAGSFVEAAATYEIAQWLVRMFHDGATVEELTDVSLREVLQRARNGSSRSSSMMSNLVEDVKGKAWSATYERLAGRGW